MEHIVLLYERLLQVHGEVRMGVVANALYSINGTSPARNFAAVPFYDGPIHPIGGCMFLIVPGNSDALAPTFVRLFRYRSRQAVSTPGLDFICPFCTHVSSTWPHATSRHGMKAMICGECQAYSLKLLATFLE